MPHFQKPASIQYQEESQHHPIGQHLPAFLAACGTISEASSGPSSSDAPVKDAAIALRTPGPFIEGQSTQQSAITQISEVLRPPPTRLAMVTSPAGRLFAWRRQRGVPSVAQRSTGDAMGANLTPSIGVSRRPVIQHQLAIGNQLYQNRQDASSRSKRTSGLRRSSAAVTAQTNATGAPRRAAYLCR
ncbi:unnamed protein product [Protopolystoma xenopodis]|uniref:Uncharacterized protein n=1 Tax=Protopolystoma xenopodis TaxID=117903 RepID=A0A448XL95_9PLAT|nr:unnamed protein product [Protopolystoma xenopodis]